MKRQGWVRFRLQGLGMEKMMNEARRRGWILRRIQREKSRAVQLEASPADYLALRALAEEKGYQVSEARAVGWLRAEKRFLSRWGVMAGAALGVALVIYALGLVWQVRVENAGPYAGEVRAFLEAEGIRPGIRKGEIDLAALRERLEWRLPRVKWVRTAFSGIALVVRLEEGTPPPDIESAGATGDVVAGEDGVLTRLTVFAGTPAARVGDAVRSGQVLIRGEEKGADGSMVPVKARGEAQARVWICARVRMPLTENRSLPTGRTAQRRVIQTPFFVWSTAEPPAGPGWDREITCVPLGGAWIPLWMRREYNEEYTTEPQERDAETVRQEGERAALRLLNQALIHEETVDKWLKCSMIERGILLIEATAEVSRNIGRYQKR